MKFFTSVLLFGLSALAQAQEPCAADSVLPCACPEGTEYIESGTFLIAGAGSPAVKAYLGDFFNTTWLRRPLISTEGEENTAGAVRVTTVDTKKGKYNISETLTSYAVAPDGSFKMLYEQTEPVEYHDGSGQFAGWWYDLQGETAFPAQAPLRFSLYACQTGHPLDFAAFATKRLNEMIKALKAQGVYSGDTLGPLSFQSF